METNEKKKIVFFSSFSNENRAFVSRTARRVACIIRRSCPVSRAKRKTIFRVNSLQIANKIYSSECVRENIFFFIYYYYHFSYCEIFLSVQITAHGTRRRYTG